MSGVGNDVRALSQLYSWSDKIIIIQKSKRRHIEVNRILYHTTKTITFIIIHFYKIHIFYLHCREHFPNAFSNHLSSAPTKRQILSLTQTLLLLLLLPLLEKCVKHSWRKWFDSCKYCAIIPYQLNKYSSILWTIPFTTLLFKVQELIVVNSQFHYAMKLLP